MGVKQPGSGADHSPTPGAKRLIIHYTHAFMAVCFTVEILPFQNINKEKIAFLQNFSQ
jgi:hypothetical protein